MTIDRTARNEMAELLRHFVTGSITNFSFEDKIPSSNDPVTWAIGSSIWCFYDDFKEHKLDNEKALPKEIKKMTSRWIMFLYSDEDYQWPFILHPGIRPLEHSMFSKLLGRPAKEKKFMSYGDYNVWPFINEESFNNAKKNPKLLKPECN